MSTKVVDTNVAVVANGRDTHASPACQLETIQFLRRLVDSGRVVVDDNGGIFAEYDRRLRPEGQPGVGDLFYRHVLDNRGNAQRVRWVDVRQPRGDALRRAFEAGGLAAFDRSDRIFALCSAVSRAPLATATDSDWPQHEAGLRHCGIKIEYVCGRATAARGGRDGENGT